MPSAQQPTPSPKRLAWRIFVPAAVVITLLGTAAAASVWYLARRVAREQLERRIELGVVARDRAEAKHYEELSRIASELIASADLQGRLSDPPTLDRAALRDSLVGEEAALGLDFVIALDASGVVLARTDGIEEAASDLSSRPLVAEALQGRKAVGVWRDGGRLHSAVALAVPGSSPPAGFLVAARRIDDRTARDVREVTGAETVFLALDGESFEIAGSTLELVPVRLLRAALDARRAILVTLTRGSAMYPVETTLSGQTWLAHVGPIRDAAGTTVGAVVCLDSLEAASAGGSALGWGLLLAAAGGLVLAGVASLRLARQVAQPVGESRPLAAREWPVEPSTVAELEHSARANAEIAGVALLAVEFRRHGAADTGPGARAERALGEFDSDLEDASAAVEKSKGWVLGVSGHRLVAVFEQLDATRAALAAASQLLLASAGSRHLPVIAVASGRAAVRRAVSEGQPSRVVGRPVQILESLMREGSSGEILVSSAAFDSIDGGLSSLGVSLSERRGLVTPIRFYALDLELARRIA